MLSWLGRTFGSSIGKKLLMALTGLLLFGFLIAHLIGNLSIYADSNGKAFDAYAHKLESIPGLPFIEAALAALFLAHIVMALRVTLQNREARGTGYKARASHGGRTAGSGTMWITGLVVLIFLVIHIYDFRWQKEDGGELAAMVKDRMTGGSGLAIYVVGMLALGIHLSHAFQSACQTFGINHPKYNGLIKGIGIGLAIVLALGFISFPVVYYLGGCQ